MAKSGKYNNRVMKTGIDHLILQALLSLGETGFTWQSAQLDLGANEINVNLNVNSSHRCSHRHLAYYCQKKKAKMVWPCLKVFWSLKNDHAGYSQRRKEKGWPEKAMGR